MLLSESDFTPRNLTLLSESDFTQGNLTLLSESDFTGTIVLDGVRAERHLSPESEWSCLKKVDFTDRESDLTESTRAVALDGEFTERC